MSSSNPILFFSSKSSIRYSNSLISLSSSGTDAIICASFLSPYYELSLRFFIYPDVKNFTALRIDIPRLNTSLFSGSCLQFSF